VCVPLEAEGKPRDRIPIESIAVKAWLLDKFVIDEKFGPSSVAVS
jgi:hypothetical protein